MMTTIVIAEDHDLVRGGIRKLLESERDFKIVGETGTGAEAIALCKSLNPDVLVLDFDLPDIDGLEVTQKIRGFNKESRILVLTMYDNEDYALRVINSGAAGFMLKTASPKELPAAIRKISGGERYVTPSIMEKIVFKGQDGEKHPVSVLSDRELQVLVKLAQGLNLREIAEELCLSQSTIKTYKRNIFEKLGLDNVADITRFAIRYNLTSK